MSANFYFGFDLHRYITVAKTVNLKKDFHFHTQMQTYTSKKVGKKNNTEGTPRGCRSVPVSVCVMQCQRDKQNCRNTIKKLPNSFQLFNSAFLTGTKLSFIAFQSQATSNKQVPRINGILYIRPLKACIGLNVAPAQWRFTTMKPYLHHVGSSLTPPIPSLPPPPSLPSPLLPQWRDLQIIT